MDTRITARHCEVSDGLQSRVKAIAARLDKLSPHALDATVIFDVTPLFHTAEIRLHARGRKMLKGTGRGPDHRTALDRAEEKLRPQLIRATEVRQDQRRKPGRPRRRV